MMDLETDEGLDNVRAWRKGDTELRKLAATRNTALIDQWNTLHFVADALGVSDPPVPAQLEALVGLPGPHDEAH